MKLRKPHELFYNWNCATPDTEIWRINWRDYGLDYCGVYVVTPDNYWPCKIGVSVSPLKRLNSLQTSVWMPLTMGAYRWCVSTDDARAIEKATHKAFKEQSKDLYGEWFDCRAEEAAEVMEWVALELGVQLGRGIPAGRDDIREYLDGLIAEQRIRQSHVNHQMLMDPNATVVSVTMGGQVQL